MINKMIKRITNNGMYVTFISFLLTYLAFKYNTDPVVLGSEVKANLMFTLVVYYIFMFFADSLTLSTYRIMHINKIEITITLIISTLFIIHTYVTNLSIHWFIWLCLTQFTIRLLNNFFMEASKFQGDSFAIRRDLKITDNFVSVKGFYKHYRVSIVTNGPNNISFDAHELTYRNRKLKINMLQQIQIDFKKDILDFTDDELTLAEMYTF